MDPLKEIDYTDQAGKSCLFGDRRISSFYTPYGISQIDSEYCNRIRNINNPVDEIFAIDRRREYVDGKYGRYLGNYDTYYDPIEVGDRGVGNGILVKYSGWDVKYKYDFIHPIFLKTTKKEDPKALKKEILNNPHLHKDIKDNLLLNLKNYLKNKY